MPERRGLPTPQSHPLTSCRHPDVSQSPPTITLPLHRKSTAGTRFKMDQMLTEGELGSPALVGELFGGEGSITCSLELEVQVLNNTKFMDNVFRTSFYLVSHIPYHGAVLVGRNCPYLQVCRARSGVLNYVAIRSSCLLGFYGYVQCLETLFFILGLC